MIGTSPGVRAQSRKVSICWRSVRLPYSGKDQIRKGREGSSRNLHEDINNKKMRKDDVRASLYPASTGSAKGGKKDAYGTDLRLRYGRRDPGSISPRRPAKFFRRNP